MNRFATACLAMALSAVPALAQQTVPATPAPPAPAAAAPVQPTAAHLAAAKDVIQLSGLSRSFEFVVPQFMDQLRQTFATTRPEIMTELTNTLMQLRPEFEAQKNDLLMAASRIFAGRMSEAELKEVATFFRSPTGQRYVAAQPLMMDDLFQEMQSWSRRLSDLMMTRTRAEMKKKNIDM
jgi:hypothetical protein